MKDKAKPVLGAVAVAAAVLIPSMYGVYMNFKEVKQTEFMEMQDRAAIRDLKQSPTPTVSVTATPSATPTKVLFYKPTSAVTVKPQVK